MNEHPTMTQLENLALLANSCSPTQVAGIRRVSVQTVSQSFGVVKGRIIMMALENDIKLPLSPDSPEYGRVASLAYALGYLKRNPSTGTYTVASRYGILTERRHQILLGIANGYTFAAIARRLMLSVNTVKTHAMNLREDLGACNSAHAVALAFERGVISSEDVQEWRLT